MTNLNTYDRFFAAVCNPADKDAINAACESVSSSYSNMFHRECLYENDPDPVVVGDSLDFSGTTIRQYSTGVVLTSKPMRRNLSEATKPWLTSANWKEVDSRGDRFPDEYDLFLANYQLRQPFGFVNSTGALRAYGGLAAQTLGGDKSGAVLVDQWEDLIESRNTHLDGSGHRMQTNFPGTYDAEIKLSWENPNNDNIHFQLTLNTSWIGFEVSRNTDSLRGKFSGLVIANETDKLGLGVWADMPGVNFKLLHSWLGIKRVA